MSADIHDKSLDYAMDKDFIEWVRSGCTSDNSRWYELRQSSSHATAVEEAIQIVENIEFKLPVTNQQRKKELFSRIESEIDASAPSRIRKLWAITAVAASLALIVSIFWPGMQSLQEFDTGYAETQKLSLPDNSQVSLNAETELKYNPGSYADKRFVDLDGEAFFEVEKGRQFVVRTPDVTVEVLGTSFNVYSRNGYAEVHCETGKVRVSNISGQDGVVLTPGESVIFQNGKLDKKPPRLSREWRKGKFNFTDARLSRVIEEMERQFDIQVDRDADVDSILYTGFFETESLDKALQSVLWPLNLEYSESGKGMIRIEKPQ